MTHGIYVKDSVTIRNGIQHKATNRVCDIRNGLTMCCWHIHFGVLNRVVIGVQNYTCIEQINI